MLPESLAGEERIRTSYVIRSLVCNTACVDNDFGVTSRFDINIIAVILTAVKGSSHSRLFRLVVSFMQVTTVHE